MEYPRTHDVVFRKGIQYLTYPGKNMYYHELIATSSDRHSRATRTEKSQITRCIMETILERNGRCLEWSRSRGSWIVVTDRGYFRQKIAAGFKHYNSRNVATSTQARAPEDALAEH